MTQQILMLILDFVYKTYRKLQYLYYLYRKLSINLNVGSVIVESTNQRQVGGDVKWLHTPRSLGD